MKNYDGKAGYQPLPCSSFLFPLKTIFKSAASAYTAERERERAIRGHSVNKI